MILFRAVVALALIGGAFWLGWYLGVGWEKGRCEAAAMAQAQEHLDEAIAYENRLRAATHQAALDRAELDRLHSATQPRRLRCTPVPLSPAPPSDFPPIGLFPPEDGPGFDPTDKAIALANEADRFVLECKSALATWP